MAVLNVNDLKISFSDRTLFDNVSFEIENGEHVGFVGANGTGKTTLFKVITGVMEPDTGYVVKGKDITLGYMEQYANAGSKRTLYDELLSVFDPLIETELRLETLSHEINEGAGDIDVLIAEQAALSDYFNRSGGLTFRARTRSTLLGLGFAENELLLLCSQLSGGQRSKLALAKLLLSGAGLLLLDEPTNHLDIDSVEWLEGFISDYKGAVIIISHDRYFLDKVTNKTMELANKKVTVYKGNYSEFVRQKAENEEFLKRKFDNQTAEIKHIEGIIEQQRRWGRERNFITAASKQKMLEKKKAELVAPEKKAAKLRFKLDFDFVSGNEVLELSDLSKSYADKKLFEDINLLLMSGDKAFILGSNGCGKTTLLRIINGEEHPDSGYVRLGANVKIGYFDQSLSGLDDKKNVLDEAWDCRRDMTLTEIRSALAVFLFKGDDVGKKVSILSGGEKARLSLLKLMLSGANFLILDEPSNHLDINALEALENALLDYEGTILAVSHDRYFINKLCTRVLHMTTSGFREYQGNYDIYLQKRGELVKTSAKKPERKPNEYKLRKEREARQRKIAGRIRRCEEEIAENEERMCKVNDLLTQPDIASDYEKVLSFTHELEEIREKLDSLMAQWEELQLEAENGNED